MHHNSLEVTKNISDDIIVDGKDVETHKVYARGAYGEKKEK